MNKNYWKQYSSVQDGNKELFVNTGNGDWALFVDGEFVQEGTEANIPSHLQDMWNLVNYGDDELSN